EQYKAVLVYPGQFSMATAEAVNIQYVESSLQPITLIQNPQIPAGASWALMTATLDGFYPVSPIYKFEPEGTQFTPPAILHYSYDSSLYGENIGLYKFNPDTNRWEYVPGQILDLASRTVVAQLNSFSFYVLMKMADRNPPAISGLSATEPVFSPNGDQIKDENTFSFSLADDSPRDVLQASAGIFDPDGRRLATLLPGLRRSPGRYENTWNGKDPQGNPVPDGSYLFKAESTDLAGNKATGQLSVAIDNTAPASTWTFVGGRPFIREGTAFVSGETSIRISADDPVVNGVSSGVKGISRRINHSPFITTEGQETTFQIPGPDGLKTIEFFSTDNAGNAEAVYGLTAALDNTAPRTQLVWEGPQAFIDLKTFISTRTAAALSAQDPLINGVAGGLAKTEFRLDAGSFELYQSSLTFIEGFHFLDYKSADAVGNEESLQLNEFYVDGTAPATRLILSGPQLVAESSQTYISETTLIALVAEDVSSTQAASGVSSTQWRVGESEYALYTGTFSLTEGVRPLDFFSADRVDNREPLRTATLLVDASTPVTTAEIGEPRYFIEGEPVFIGPNTPITITAQDPDGSGAASGVATIYYRVVASTDTPFVPLTAAGITLSGFQGLQSIEFFSIDRVGHEEAIQRITVQVDSQAPSAQLVSPNPQSLGVGRVFDQTDLPILGTVSDGHFTHYNVSYATASGPTSPSSGSFTTLYTSTQPATGLLATWNTSNQTGWFTLRVTALDTVQNATVVETNVYLGEPVRSLSIGKNEQVNFELKQPDGVAVDSQGNIYVGEKANGSIRKFSPTGILLATFGGGIAYPSGLTVDTAGNIFVADRQNNQVVKLSPQGAVLMKIGKFDANGIPQPGSGAGEFHDPTGLSVDAAGNIYVADRKNARIQKFSSSGQSLAVIDLDAADPLPNPHNDISDSNDPTSGPHARPWAVAVDLEGNIWVSDDRHSRVLKLSSTGTLLDAVGQKGKSPGSFKIPQGIGISPQNYLYVADRDNNRVQKFDAALNPVLIFGEKDPQATLTMQKPVGMALGADGKVYVTNSEKGKVQVYDAPTGTTGYGTLSLVSPLRRAGTPDAAFRLGEVYSFPNPAKRTNPTIHVEAGLADRVEIRFYDISGQLIHETEMTGNPRVVQDGSGVDYAFEYTWDVSDMASGVYIYVIQAHKNGEEDLRKVSKLAVIK
ncbi:MAG: hypothetical protein HY548_08890, partial [Elusimicrobia bacterium]|nr:hypothetical protein [Elusimicrobiota bacterium]